MSSLISAALTIGAVAIVANSIKSNSIKSINDFEKTRASLTAFVRNNIVPFLYDTEHDIAVVRAPVKSGKRGMVEIASMLDYSTTPNRVHAFISAWHRKADDDQRIELGKYNLHVFSIFNTSAADKCYAWIQSQLNAGKTVVIHLDECDYGTGNNGTGNNGTGNRQILNKLWVKIRNLERVKKILYSATPEEVCFSGELDDPDELSDDIVNGSIMEYSPAEGDGFCGPQKFLDEGLVIEATRFFVKTPTGIVLTEQGREIVRDLRQSMQTNPKRNFLALRLSYADGKGKENKAIYQFLYNCSRCPELNGFIISADKSDIGIKISGIITETIQWSDRIWWNSKSSEKPSIIVYDQTSSRSTEWACHDRIFATHDYRHDVVFSVVSQAQERVNHYVKQQEDYNGFQRIRVYGSVKTWQLSARRITYQQYLENEWKMRKVDRRVSPEDLYTIIKNSDNTPHPVHSARMTKDQAELILESLGCLATSTISSRVKGAIKNVPKVEPMFIPCTKETFATVREWGPRVQNPFVNAEQRGLVDGKYKSHIRGNWSVRTYDDIVNENWGFGRNTTERRCVCYKDGVEGIYYGQVVGTMQQDTLDAYKSMYPSRR